MDNIPSSVYRLQVGRAFPLTKAKNLIPYLHDLGIEGVYCSPVFDSYSYGYDITDPTKLNPDLGTDADFEAFCLQLKKYKMKHLLDIVPNHMGIKGDRNHWWLDVLENGPGSSYADFFDINWNPEEQELKGKILLPILKQDYRAVLKKKQILLFWKNGFCLRYSEFFLPISKHSYHLILPQSKEQLILEQKSIDFEQAIRPFNEQPELLQNLLEKQYYRLAFWKMATPLINYRKFFNINELIAICIEKEKVLKAHHRWIFQLIKSNQVQGLRIDHLDGLYDPDQYLERIKKKKPVFIWIEKILAFKEKLLKNWEIDGTVGYDFLNLLSSLFVQKKNEKHFTRIYEKFTEEKIDFETVHYERRKNYIFNYMLSDLNALEALLNRNDPIDFIRSDLKRALLEIVACFPVYRTYIKPGAAIRKEDRKIVLQTIQKARQKAPDIPSSLFLYIQSLLLESQNPSDFVFRFQQFTAPVMAKGLEDSTFYIYNRLISLNEVGGFPNHFGITKKDFHQFNQKNAAQWPLSALATSTHDTKFSEDARLRLHAISERPKEWKKLVFSLKKRNQKYKSLVHGKWFPDFNTEYFLYQMILALWPAKQKRLWICFQKAMRQAGIHTSWKNPCKKAEEAAKKFLKKAIQSPNHFSSFLEKIENNGHQNSLSALVLKLGSCGIFDLYQGNELMNYHLMDPDNRHSVDFKIRKKCLKKMNDLKLKITARGLRYRREHKELFLKGSYIPISSPNSIIAFLRIWKNQIAIVIVRRFFQEKQRTLYLKLPVKIPMVQNIFTDEKISIQKNRISLSKALNLHSFAILIKID